MHNKKLLAFFGGDLLTTVQYLAWVDLLSFFIILGPTIILFLATQGLTPTFKQERLVFENKTVKSPIVLYKADRSMTVDEYRIVQWVREGCGREYIRDFPPRWAAGRSHFVIASSLFSFGMALNLVSGLCFLIIVPSRGFVGKYMPIVHLCCQIVSISSSLAGCWQLCNENLCFLNHVWPFFKIPTGITVITVLTCLTYKMYESLVIRAFLMSHLQAIKEAEALMSSPSQEIQALMNEMQTKNEAIEESQTLPASTTRNWETVDSDINSIIEGMRNRVDLKTKENNLTTSLTTNFFDNSNSTLASTTIQPSVLTSSMSQSPKIEFGPPKNVAGQDLRRVPEERDLTRDDGMTIILPVRNFKDEDQFKSF